MDTRGKWRTAEGEWIEIRRIALRRLWFTARFMAETRVRFEVDARGGYLPIPMTTTGRLPTDATVENAELMDRLLRETRRTIPIVSPLSQDYIEKMPIPGLESITGGHVIAIDPALSIPNNEAMLPAGRDGKLWLMVDGVGAARRDKSGSPIVDAISVLAEHDKRSYRWNITLAEVLGVQRFCAAPIVRPVMTSKRVEMTIKCTACDGAGKLGEGYLPAPCHLCGGAGILTYSGDDSIIPVEGTTSTIRMTHDKVRAAPPVQPSNATIDDLRNRWRKK